MEIFATAWAFLISHWANVVAVFSAIKPVADTIDSVKKVLPEHLESKKTTQDYLDTSAKLLNDQSIPVEEKEWELNTRQELAKSMVHITAIEAAYQIARGTLIVALYTIFMHYFTKRFASRRRTP